MLTTSSTIIADALTLAYGKYNNIWGIIKNHFNIVKRWKHLNSIVENNVRGDNLK
jgi:hypothetical protein